MIARVLFITLMAFTTQACSQDKASAAPAKTAQGAPAKPVFKGEDAVVSAALQKIAPGVVISSIKASPLPGIKEVMVDGRVLYVSNDGKYLLQGSLIEMPSRRNLSQASEAQERKGLLAGIPASQKITFAPANPKYRVTVFTDIDCGFCRKMHTQIADYNKAGISVEYLFFPRAGEKSESWDKAVSVWCAPNRQKALTDAKADRPVPKKTCTNPIAEDYALGRKVGVDGTPAVFGPDGTQLGGYLPPAEVLAKLNRQAARVAGK